MRIRSTRSTLVALAIVAWPGTVGAQKKTVEMKAPFTYDSRGVGANPVSNVVTLPPNGEDEAVSRRLLDALQRMQFSVRGQNLSADVPLAPNQEYQTDTVPLSRDLIASHDQAFPQLRLGTGLIYGLKFTDLQYSIDTRARTRSVVIKVTPVVEHRGAASSNWSPHRDYSAEFFAERLFQEVRRNLGLQAESSDGR